MDVSHDSCGSGELCCRSSGCAVSPKAISLEHVLTVTFHERIWQVHWNENAQTVTIYLVATDQYGNARTLKKIKVIRQHDSDFPIITDGRSLLEASTSLVGKYSSKSAAPEFFIGTK